LTDLRLVNDSYPNDVALIGQHRIDSSGAMRIRLRLHTKDIPRVDGGLPLDDYEDVLVTVGPTDLVPPSAEVDHDRFIHHPHVLQGSRLCLYLDVPREWDPLQGFGGFLDRLFSWLADAASARFDAQTALHHAVGGVLHAAAGAPTIVVRQPLPPGKWVQHGWLSTRTQHRRDLALDRPPGDTTADHSPVVLLDADLPLGGGCSLADLLARIDIPHVAQLGPGSPYTVTKVDRSRSAIVLTALGASAIRKPDGSAQNFVIAVPHPAGGPPHLLAACIPAAAADHLRTLVRVNRDKSPLIDIDPAELDRATPLQWWPVSDERPEVTTRRDSQRPVAGFAGKTVAVWGCGGLGSWIAEYVVRAGVKKMVLCDHSTITGGLLVRQNFVEADVGDTKIAALARRLGAISDTVEITVYDALAPTLEDLLDTDVVIDATVSIAVSRLLEHVARLRSARTVLAQVTTDSRTATLGMLTVSAPARPTGPLSIDRAAGEIVSRQATLEPFYGLWDTAAGDQLIPTRGCSTPTFHGSAADLAGVAASLTSILGAHLQAESALSGTHLISLPHGEAGPLREFLQADPDQPAPGRAGGSD
jgi:hypothetical protein